MTQTAIFLPQILCLGVPSKQDSYWDDLWNSFLQVDAVQFLIFDIIFLLFVEIRAENCVQNAHHSADLWFEMGYYRSWILCAKL